MALLDVIKFENQDDGLFVWKHPSTSLKWGSQLAVGEGQCAIFVKGGQICDSLPPGTHTLNTGNIPILEKLINVPFGGDTPFTAEVWFVSTLVKRDLKWGTPRPIQVVDRELGLPVSIRSTGRWGIRITEPESFLKQLVGTQGLTDSSKILNYFGGVLNQSLTAQISSDVTEGAVSVLTITATLEELSERAAKLLSADLSKYGIELINFNIETISIPDDELQQIQDVLRTAFEARELSKVSTGGAFAQVKSFEVLQALAENPSSGSTGDLLGAGLGAGLGLGAGIPLGGQMAQHVTTESAESTTAESASEKLRELKSMLDEGLITPEQYEQKRQQLLDQI